MSQIPRILLALQDDAYNDVLPFVTDNFTSDQQEVASAKNLQSMLSSETYHILLLDCSFPHKLPFVPLLERITADHPEMLIIPLIPEEKDNYIKAAIELNAFFYVTLPLDASELTIALKRAQTKCSHHLNSRRHKKSDKRYPFSGFIGNCTKMQNLFELIYRVADDEFSTVLIRGESGTGKELVAKAIHSKSSRKNNNFVPVNCAAIPDDLLESELFGHMKGSFTGATQTKQGRIQYADRGTLFLDEIGDMKPALQAKLLRVIQEKEFEPVGSLKATPVDTRIVAATHCDLEKLVNEGQFREDLYYRLSVIPIQVPPLRERTEDIPLLLNEFIDLYTSKRGRKKVVFSPQSLAILMKYEWRGNVRELENLVQHMSILYGGKNIQPKDLPAKYTRDIEIDTLPDYTDQLAESSLFDHSQERAELLAPISPSGSEVNLEEGPVNFNDLINQVETGLIIKALKLTSGNKKEAARILSLKRTTLLEKIKKKELNGLWEEN
jgi:DNA-binding NtrC family response regulator